MQKLLWVLVIACVGLGCSTIKEVKESQQTHAEVQVGAVADTAMAVALEVLPEFDLIATATYWSGGFIQAQGDWDSEHEGALIQISVKQQNAVETKVVVEAGNSAFDTTERKLALARKLAARIAEQVAARTTSPE